MTMESSLEDLIEGRKDTPGTATTPARHKLFMIPNESNPLLPDNFCKHYS